MAGKESSFTGRTRKRTTSPLVWWTDRIAKGVIGIGGVGTIIAVLLVCVFLFYVAVPLFLPPKLDEERTFETDWISNTPKLLGVDEYRLIGWALLDNGDLHVFRLDNGEALGQPLNVRRDAESDVAGPQLTAASRTADGTIALGFADGTFRTGEVGFSTQYFELGEAPEAARNLAEGEIYRFENGIALRTGGGQIRIQRLDLTLSPAQQAKTSHPCGWSITRKARTVRCLRL